MRTPVDFFTDTDGPSNTKEPETVFTLSSNYGKAYLSYLLKHEIKTGISWKVSVPRKFHRRQSGQADVDEFSSTILHVDTQR